MKMGKRLEDMKFSEYSWSKSLMALKLFINLMNVILDIYMVIYIKEIGKLELKII